ncbi:MAG: D-amino-acid transaminase [Candidatus Sedimenticola sp. (ex Thyasira tokunagai)]
MSRIVYVNGEFLAEEDAMVSIFDRGFLFADGVYEVSSVLCGKLIDNSAHMVRLHRSLNELEMDAPISDEEIEAIQHELVARNGVDEGMIYLQVTRGAADRDFAYPKGATPTLVIFTQAKQVVDIPQVETGISVITTRDIRWRRRDIKTVGLLAPSMAKMAAKKAGADDAWMVEDGFITEGTSNNAYIVTTDGTLITRQLGSEILHGITRRAVLKLATESGIAIEERPFSVEEALAASEAFITSATTFVMPVTSIDGHKIGGGNPGELTLRLRQLYIDMALKEAESLCK